MCLLSCAFLTYDLCMSMKPSEYCIASYVNKPQNALVPLIDWSCMVGADSFHRICEGRICTARRFGHCWLIIIDKAVEMSRFGYHLVIFAQGPITYKGIEECIEHEYKVTNSDAISLFF
eukprot:552817_1